jgi:hypothetical protein
VSHIWIRDSSSFQWKRIENSEVNPSTIDIKGTQNIVFLERWKKDSCFTLCDILGTVRSGPELHEPTCF